MVPILFLALAQSSNISVSVQNVRNTDYTGSGPAVTCQLSALSWRGRRASTTPDLTKSGSPVLELLLASPNVNNPQSVTVKIRYQPQTEGQAIVYRDSAGVKASTRATATDAQTVSFSVPRDANGTRQLQWGSTPTPPKPKTVFKAASLPAWQRVNGQSTTLVSIPTGYMLQVTTKAESPEGKEALKDESQANASSKLHVNVLSVYGTKTTKTRSYGSLSGPPANLFVDVYNLDGSVVDFYWLNPDTLTSGTYELDFEDFSTKSVKAYYYVTGSLRKLYTFNGTLSYMVNFTPTMGDVDGDNDIDSTDVSLLTANLGATSETFESLEGTFYFEAYDLNRDGVIDSLDVAIAQANVGLIGDF